jgi:hypothetical protein
MARAAIDCRIECDTIARAPRFHARAGRHDFAGGLVPHDERRVAPAGGAIPAVNVAAANSARANLVMNMCINYLIKSMSNFTDFLIRFFIMYY